MTRFLLQTYNKGEPGLVNQSHDRSKPFLVRPRPGLGRSRFAPKVAAVKTPWQSLRGGCDDSLKPRGCGVVRSPTFFRFRRVRRQQTKPASERIERPRRAIYILRYFHSTRRAKTQPVTSGWRATREVVSSRPERAPF